MTDLRDQSHQKDKLRTGDCREDVVSLWYWYVHPFASSGCKAQTFQTPALAAFDIKVDASSCFPELLLAVANVDVACRYCTLAIGAGKGVYCDVVVLVHIGRNYPPLSSKPPLGMAPSWLACQA
jgi:hypothetical protein